MFKLVSIVVIILLTLIFYFLFNKNKISVANNLLMLTVKLIVLSAGLIIVYINTIEFEHYQQRENWPKVMGKVIAFEIVGIKTREPEIHYSFTVHKKVYNGKTNLATPLFGSRKYQEQTARTISGNYQVGDSVIVYYNPDHPEESVLKIHPGWSVYMQLSFGLIIVAAVLALIIPAKSKEGHK